MLALLKMGFTRAEAETMPEILADAWIESYVDAITPKPKKKTYKVRRR